MPEGDAIHRAATRVGAALVGREILSIETPQARHRPDRWPERLAGRDVRSVDARGKHLFVRFGGGLTLHSHLRMRGRWDVYRRGDRWRRSRRRAWLVLRTDEHEVVQFDGPVLELMTDARTRFDQRLAALGPDILDATFSAEDYLRRLREDDPTRAIGEALLDQRNVAGLGNIWRSEVCHLAGLDPWRRVGDVSDGEALGLVRTARPLMLRSAEGGERVVTVEPRGTPAARVPARGGSDTRVYGRAGLPCRRCGAIIRSRGQGDDNRTVYWCPSCQR